MPTLPTGIISFKSAKAQVRGWWLDKQIRIVFKILKRDKESLINERRPYLLFFVNLIYLLSFAITRPCDWRNMPNKILSSKICQLLIVIKFFPLFCNNCKLIITIHISPTQNISGFCLVCLTLRILTTPFLMRKDMR